MAAGAPAEERRLADARAARVALAVLRDVRCAGAGRIQPGHRVAVGAEHLGIGTDLCQDQPDSVVTWMRVGRWTKGIDYGEGSASNVGFPPMPTWFNDNRDFGNIRAGLESLGMSREEIDGIMGGNWLRFYEESFGPL